MANAFYALSGNNLLSFDHLNPSAVATTAITGVNGSETLVGIDFRPNNGMLYGLGVNAAANTATLYLISQRTGFATPVGTVGQVALTTDGVTAVDLPDPATVGWSFDFNPAADRVRVTTGSGLNFRINPNTGAAVDGDNGGAVTTGVNPDGPISGAGVTGVEGTAYTNNQPNHFATTLYTLDATSNALLIQNPPNAGTQTLATTVTLNGSTLDFTGVNGFDIWAGVNTASNNTPVATGLAFAVLNVGGLTGLYGIDLVNGVASFFGNIGGGASAIQGLAIHNDLGGFPAVVLSSDGTTIVRFNTATTGTTTTQALNLANLVSGEQLVAIDFRPQTGQLYALGIDATANTGTLYLLDPQSGVVSIAVAGTASDITFAGTDFPDPATIGYGMDFNPTIDRIRITTDSGLNFRINPITGLPAAATPDVAINGSGVTGVSATAYTNSYGQSLSGGVTTLYTLDAASNMLFIQNPANNGTQTNGLAVTLGGSALNFTSVNGFDIPGNVNVAASGSAAVGFGYASLTVGATTGLYQIDLASGAATHLGTVGSGAFAGFTLADRPSAPVITSNGAGGTANLSVAENISAVTIVTAIDADLHALTYAIVGGADAARFTIDASTGALSFISAPNFEAPTDADGNNSYTVLVMASDGAAIDAQTITVNVTDVDEVIHINGTAGTDVFDAPGAEAEMNGFGGVDTVRFNFNLTEATVTYSGNKVIIDGPSSHTELTGFETFVFTDGTVNNNDGNAPVDDLFYYARYHDVWNAQVDADAHYAVHGWHEGRDPSAFFDTSFYLAISADARAAGTNPLTHFDQVGWKEGRIPSLQFDTLAYLAANPDVKAANVDPLAHFLQHGASEGRQPSAPTEYLAPNGFDYIYYLAHNPDVAAAGIDPFVHFQTFGWKEGRNPNALFDTNGYLATYTDVQAAGVNPLDHYHTSGFLEARDPSVGFDTLAYRTAYPDVAAANIDPLAHFLDFGRHEGRSPFADGVFG